MMSLAPFWEMLKRNNITVYNLEYDYDLNPADISRLKNNHNYSLKSLNRFCNLFHCRIEDIVVFIPDEDVSE
jgi:DNA-binding Xre family transcriptional regulator